MDERLPPPMPEKCDIEITKNYKGITLSAIASKIYNALLLKWIQSEVEKVFRKNQNMDWY